MTRYVENNSYVADTGSLYLKKRSQVRDTGFDHNTGAQRHDKLYSHH